MKTSVVQLEANKQLPISYCKSYSHKAIYTLKYRLTLSISKFDMALNRFKDLQYDIDICPVNGSKNFQCEIAQISHCGKILSKNSITITKCGTYTFDIDIKCEVESGDFKEVDKNPYSINIVITDSGKNINTTTCSFEIIKQPICARCREFISTFCTIVHDDTFNYSDINCKDTDYTLATIKIEPPKAADVFSVPQKINLSWRVKYLTLTNGFAGNKVVKPCEISTPIEIPIKINVAQLDKPIDNHPIEIELTYSYEHCGRTQQGSVKSVINYQFAPEFNRLAVTALEKTVNGKSIDTILRNKYYTPLQDVQLFRGTGSVTKYIKISNLATENLRSDVGIHVYDISTWFASSDDEKNRLLMTGEECWTGNRMDGKNEFLLTPSNPTISIPIVFDYNRLKGIAVVNNNRYMDWRMNLKFKYKIDSYSEIENPNTEQKELVVNKTPAVEHDFCCTIGFRICNIAPHKWLAVDFGTAAIVTFEMLVNEGLIKKKDLKRLKRQLIAENYNGADDAPKRIDNSEQADGLIASTLYVNPIGNNNANYASRPLWFSPTSGMVNPDCEIPCLKYMVGNMAIPDIEAIKKNEIIKSETQSVAAVTKSVYQQLCQYYLKGDTEALVLTVPNTFTPIHIGQIRRILLQSLNCLPVDMLEFVSESDAVLCCYLRHRQKLNIYGEEYILIYDMGAGTLDITYARCYFGTDGSCSVEIIGKFGVNKAGNYIDHLLGEIIVDLLKDKADQNSISLITKALSVKEIGTDYISKKNFKDYLRNKIKTSLNGDTSDKLPTLDAGNYDIFGNSHSINEIGNISIGNILRHDMFIEYINSCTEETIKSMAENYGDIHNKLKIDKVILSGRTTALDVIRNNLADAVNRHNSNRAHFIDLKDITENLGEDMLKLVVAKGALDYMHFTRFNNNFKIQKKPLYGYYGIMTMSGNTPRSWIELASHKSLFINSYNDDGEIYSTEITLPCNGMDAIHLCHSFEKDTLKFAKAGNCDSITTLHRLPISTWSGKDIGITIRLHKNGEIEYSVGGTDYKLEPHDDYNSSSMRKSLWPIVYK